MGKQELNSRIAEQQSFSCAASKRAVELVVEALGVLGGHYEQLVPALRRVANSSSTSNELR